MEFSIKQSSPDKQRSDCVVMGVFEGGKLSPSAKLLDKAAKHAISDLIARGDMSGKSATTLLLHKLPGVTAERVMLAGLGKASELNNKATVAILGAVFKSLNGTPTRDATLYFIDEDIWKDAAWIIRQAVFASSGSVYRSDSLKSKPAKAATLKNITFATLDKPSAALKHTLDQAAAIAHGMDLAKTLGDLPGNVCTPTYLAAKALSLAKAHKSIKTTVLEEKDMKKLGMGSLLSVTQGSAQARQAHHAGISRHRQETQTRRAGRQGHHLRFTAASPSSPAPRWTR